METEKPKSIKTIGIVIAALAGLTIFSNGMGFLTMKLMMSQGAPGSDTFFSTFERIAMIGLSIGLGYLLSGIGIAKYQNWGRWLGTVVSLFSIVAIWGLMTFLRTGTEELGIFVNYPFVVAAFWSILPGILVYFLHRKTTKIHFT